MGVKYNRMVLEFHKNDDPIVFSSRIDQGYSQVLFATKYSPSLLQKEGLHYEESDYPLVLHPHSRPVSFGLYRFEPFEEGFQGFPSAFFVVPGTEPALTYLAPQDFGQRNPFSFHHPKLDRLKTINYPDGAIAYEILRKRGESCSPTMNVVWGPALIPRYVALRSLLQTMRIHLRTGMRSLRIPMVHQNKLSAI